MAVMGKWAQEASLLVGAQPLSGGAGKEHAATISAVGVGVDFERLKCNNLEEQSWT